MTIISLFIRELQEEVLTTRKMLARVPADKMQWAPHAKNMPLDKLATHIADLPAWIAMAFELDELDFDSTTWEPKEISSPAELLDIFEASMEKGMAQLTEANGARLGERWVLRQGETILWDTDRWGMARMAISQMIHHRAQLGMYLRLLNIPIPGSYGPSADEA
jgi:uncharacterized damage-inducible protein DinB